VTDLSTVESYMNSYLYDIASSEAQATLEDAIILLEIAQTSPVIPEFGTLPISIILVCFISISSIVFIVKRRRNNGKTV